MITTSQSGTALDASSSLPAAGRLSTLGTPPTNCIGSPPEEPLAGAKLQ